ncbi:MAG: allantoinase [Phycisphaerales bacterium]|nr:allantoinase [Phycisphaerales bacterium]
MPLDLLIRNGLVVTPDGVRPLDVGVADGAIVELAAGLGGSAREEVDAAGLHVFPGLIDAHVHFNEPGRTDWEGFDTGSAALAAGGGTCFFDMPLNAHPPTLDGPSFDLKRAAAEASSRTDFALWGGLTPDNLDKLKELADRGVVGFKAFMSNSGIDDFGRADDLTLYRGMQAAARLGLPVVVHAESEELTGRLTAEARAAGRRGVRDYLNSRPILAEVDAIRRAILFAAETRCSLHVVHISSTAGLDAVAEARRAGANVTGETCPHYLALSADDVERIGAAAKCAPPLRPADEVELMWLQLEAGGFDLVASDHSPAPASLKTDSDFFKVWGGIAGVQSTRSVLLSRDPPLALALVARLTSSAPAERFGIKAKGTLAIGQDADLALVEIAASYALRRDDLLDRHRLSPYVGRSFRGVTRRTIVRGHMVFRDGRTVGDFRGRFLAPTRREAAGA